LAAGPTTSRMKDVAASTVPNLGWAGSPEQLAVLWMPYALADGDGRGKEDRSLRSVMNLSMCVRRCDDHALVSVEGDVDINSAPQLQQHLMHLLEGTRTPPARRPFCG